MAVTSIATDCGASCALVSGGVLTLSGSLLESSMTITVGGSPCVPVAVASNGASATCPLPVGTGGDAQVLVNSHPLAAGIADQVTYDCPARTNSAVNGKCVFEAEVREEPLDFNNVCPDASTAGSFGCNNDIVQPNGTDDDYNETLLTFLLPVGGVAGFIAAFVIVAVTILYFTKSPYLKHLGHLDRFGGLHSVNENAAMRFTKTPLGGFVSLLFGSALLVFAVYSLTGYVKDNEVVLKVPTTVNVIQAHSNLAYFDMKVSITLHGAFEAGSLVTVTIAGVERKGSAILVDATSTGVSTSTRDIEWACSDCRFTLPSFEVTATLASKREALFAMKWSVNTNSYDPKQGASAHGLVRAASNALFTRRIPVLGGICAGGVGAPSGVVVADTNALGAAINIIVKAVPVYYARDARMMIMAFLGLNRPGEERVGLELSYSHELVPGETCELELWTQATASGDQRGPTVRLQLELSAQSWVVTQKQRSEGIQLLVAVSALMATIRLVFYYLLMVMEAMQGPVTKVIEKIQAKIVAKKKNANAASDDDEVVAAGEEDVGSAEEEPNGEDDEDQPRRPVRDLVAAEPAGDDLAARIAAHEFMLREFIRDSKARHRDYIARHRDHDVLHTKFRGISAAVHTLIDGGSDIQLKEDSNDTLWSLGKLDVSCGAFEGVSDEFRLLAVGTFVLEESHARRPTWQRTAGSEVIRIYHGHEHWYIGIQGERALARSAVKSDEAAPMDVEWEVRDEVAGDAGGAVGAWRRFDELTVNVVHTRTCCHGGIFKRIERNPASRAAPAAEEIRLGGVEMVSVQNRLARAPQLEVNPMQQDQAHGAPEDGEAARAERRELVPGAVAAADDVANPMHQPQALDVDAAARQGGSTTRSAAKIEVEAFVTHPRGWIETHSRSQNMPYYTNEHTGETVWTKPTLPAPPAGWTVHAHGENGEYYHNESTGATLWEHPHDEEGAAAGVGDSAQQLRVVAAASGEGNNAPSQVVAAAHPRGWTESFHQLASGRCTRMITRERRYGRSQRFLHRPRDGQSTRMTRTGSTTTTKRRERRCGSTRTASCRSPLKNRSAAELRIGE